jgi:hypothetical protein
VDAFRDVFWNSQGDISTLPARSLFPDAENSGLALEQFPNGVVAQLPKI